MAETLTYSEVINQKKATEKAIAKLLTELQEQTGCLIHYITTTKYIGSTDTEIKVSIFLNR